jgi:hypothetical protein
VPVNQIRRNGSYAPLSAHYYKDDAIADAGPMAELLYVRSLAFSADVLSDGYISDTQLLRFVGVGIPSVRKHADALCKVDLWIREDGGYRIVTWSKWNLTKAEIQEKQHGMPRGRVGSRREESTRSPNGIHTESESLARGRALYLLHAT